MAKVNGVATLSWFMGEKFSHILLSDDLLQHNFYKEFLMFPIYNSACRREFFRNFVLTPEIESAHYVLLLNFIVLKTYNSIFHSQNIDISINRNINIIWFRMSHTWSQAVISYYNFQEPHVPFFFREYVIWKYCLCIRKKYKRRFTE